MFMAIIWSTLYVVNCISKHKNSLISWKLGFIQHHNTCYLFQLSIKIRFVCEISISEYRTTNVNGSTTNQSN